LGKKIAEAKRHFDDGRWRFVNPIKVTPDLEELGYDTADEITAAIGGALSEVLPAHYDGKRPPERAYEPVIKNRELFPFWWESAFFACEMYFKFVVADDGLWIVSLHKSTQDSGA